MRIQLDALRDLVRRALRHYGYNEREIPILEDVLVYAQLRDNNQGVVKLIGRGMPRDANAGIVTAVRETKLSVLLDGQKNHGMVVLNQAVDVCIARAREHGFGIAGTFNTNTSTGAIGYFARRIADAGFIGMVFAGSPPTVSPHGSFEPIFGTNPLAMAVPTEGEPVVFDMTTAAMAWYGLVEASTAGRSIPADVAYDSEGNPTTDPAAAMKGAIRPFDRGQRGSGLSLMIEILTGPLVAAAFAGAGDSWGNWGNLALAIDADLLVDRGQFRRAVSLLVAQVKAAKRLPGVDEILVPGERGDRLTRHRLETNEIEIDDALLHELRQVAGVA